MHICNQRFSRFSLGLTLLLSGLGFTGSMHATEVKIDRNAQGNFVLIRNGKPFPIRGAGGTSHLKELAEHGGNSIRTWGIESLEEVVDGKPLIDRCHELGLSITAGIWLEHERHGFDYSNESQVRRQREKVRSAVRKYKDHPAILMWGLGNEMEGPESNGKTPHVWKELNVLAKIVKEEDPHHPIMTVIAGAASFKVRGLLEHTPLVDVLGVNAYIAASSAASDVKRAGWKKPFVLAEYGPSGHWEVDKTRWGAPIEPGSREKSASYYATLSLLEEEAADISLGSYCFLWGQKQETTSTWYGMFLRSGEKLPQVDAISRAWTGKWPENRCPRVISLESDLREAVVPATQVMDVVMEATDPNGDPLTWTWEVVAESKDIKSGGDKESVPPSIPNCVIKTEGGKATVRTPSQPGEYRLFVTVKDGRGAAAAENFCFKVE